jgi:RNA polymerase sigma-70 factor (ECF subfamily)
MVEKIAVNLSAPIRMLFERPSPEATPDDRALLERLRSGDAEAWSSLAAAFRQRLRDMAASTLPAEVTGRADASDIVQQTLAEAHQAFSAFHGKSLQELYVWLAAILNNNVNDAVREHVMAQRRTVRAECHLEEGSHAGGGWDAVSAPDQTTPSKAAARAEAHERLQQAIEKLPPRQRTAVRMRHLENRPLADIATELDCTPQAAAAAIARGLRALRDELHDLNV